MRDPPPRPPAGRAIGQGQHADRLDELRARQPVAHPARAALQGRRLVPDRLPSEGHEHALYRIKLGRVQMREDTREHRLSQPLVLQAPDGFGFAHRASETPGDDGEHQQLAAASQCRRRPHRLEGLR